MRAERRWWILLALPLWGCSSEPEVPPEDPNIPLEELCAELAAADCARLDACGALRAPFDVARCEAYQAAVACAPTQAAIAASVAAGSLDYFELAARDCKAAVSALSCEVGFRYDLLALDACRGMVTAKGAEGGECHLGFDCVEGLHCDRSAACPGICRATLGNNQPCTFGDRCADDLYCDVTAMRCLARVDRGGTCALALSGNACVDDSFCDRSNPASPVCAAARGRNQGCQTNGECAQGGACINNRCSLGKDGDACNFPFDCEANLTCVSGSCRGLGALDDACMVGGPPCDAGLTCTSTMGATRCRPQIVPPAACAEDGPGCLLGRCVAGACIEATADGEPCVEATQCRPGRVCEGGRCLVAARDCRG